MHHDVHTQHTCMHRMGCMSRNIWVCRFRCGCKSDTRHGHTFFKRVLQEQPQQRRDTNMSPHEWNMHAHMTHRCCMPSMHVCVLCMCVIMCSCSAVSTQTLHSSLFPSPHMSHTKTKKVMTQPIVRGHIPRCAYRAHVMSCHVYTHIRMPAAHVTVHVNMHTARHEHGTTCVPASDISSLNNAH